MLWPGAVKKGPAIADFAPLGHPVATEAPKYHAGNLAKGPDLPKK
jgi:hypothetical protein